MFDVCLLGGPGISPHQIHSVRHIVQSASFILAVDWRLISHTFHEFIQKAVMRRDWRENSLVIGGSAFSFLRRDRRLDTTEKYFLTCLVDLADEQGRVHLPLERLHEETGISTGKLSSAIKVLAALHYIRASKAPNETGHESWLIYLGDGVSAPSAVPSSERSVTTQVAANGMRVTVIVEPGD